MLIQIIAGVFALASTVTAGSEVGAVVAHPPVDSFYTCSEHFAGQFNGVGDALGTDCVPQRLVEEHGRLWLRSYEGGGETNEQWYGWKMELMAPCDCTVETVYVNPKDNEPGIMGSGRASSITLARADGVRFLLAHVQDVQVEEGAKVNSGQFIARIGNNGYARSPHVHVAAWKGTDPLQIRWDQNKMQLPPEFRKEVPHEQGGAEG